MDKTKTIAIIAVVIIVVAACAVAAMNLGKDKSDSSFTIVDGKGTEFKFDGPIDGIVSVNTNIPKAMKILGYEDQLKGLSFYASTADKDQASWDEFKDLFPNAQHMTPSKTLTGEEIIDKAKVKYVVAPVKSMTTTADQEKEYNNLGIQVIRLDCNGDTFFEDVEKLITLFGGKDATNAKYDSFNKMYNDVINTVLDKAKGTDFSDETFIAYFNSGKAFYNQTAVVSNDIEKLYGKNALRSISGLDLSGVTNDATQDGIKENVIKVDGDKPIDKIFFRGSGSTSDTDSAESAWAESVLAKNYSSLSAIDAGEVYVFNSDIMSGAMAFVGFVIYAEIIGIDTGYDTADLVEQYNETYGFNENTTGLAFQIVDGEAYEIVVI